LTDAVAKQEVPASPRGSRDWWIWAATGVALSPVLSDLAIHWGHHPWSRYSIVFAVCYALALRAESPGPPLRWQGFALLIAGLVGQMLALLASVVFVARPLAAISIIGVSFIRGKTSLRVALLALAIIPVPSALVRNMGGIQLEAGIYRIALAMLSPFEINLGIQGQWVLGDGIRIRIDAIDGLAVLFIHMFFLAYYLALRRGLDGFGTARLIAIWMLLAVPIQVVVDTIYLAIVANAVPLGIADFLYASRWVVPTLSAVWIEARRRRRSRISAVLRRG
jgi:hypothetical protein